MIDISKWAFENKKLIYFLIAVLIVGGAYSSYEMSKLEDPEVTVKVAMVVTTVGRLLYRRNNQPRHFGTRTRRGSG